MPTFAYINSSPTNTDRLQVILNDLAPIKNYNTLNPLISEIVDVRDSQDGTFIEVVMQNEQNYYIAATAVWSPSNTGIFPIDKVNDVVMATNQQLMAAILDLIKPPI